MNVQPNIVKHWHFIGNIQSNKTKLIANHFDWVHSITRYKIAERLNNQRVDSKPLNVCIQVKIDEDDTRESVNPDQIKKLINAMGNLENIRVRGLMGISIPESSIEDRKKSFENKIKTCCHSKIPGTLKQIAID